MAKKASKKTIKIQQYGSPIRRHNVQGLCLKALGLGKMNSIREVEDSPSIRGLIAKLPHMVRVLEQ